MNQKKYLLLLVCFGMILLTGCGARVVSQTNFDYGGGGTREVEIYISDIVNEVSENDLQNIDDILKAAVPEGMNYARSIEENGELKYHFMFSFSDIDDYNAKVSRFIGRKHDATWFTNESVFLSNIQFSEKDCSYDLASWAVSALQNSNYKRFTTLFDSKTARESVINLAGEEVFRGTGDPSFTKEMAPIVSSATMYTTFDDKGGVTHQLVLTAEPEKLEQMDLKRAKAELSLWCEDTTIDRGNGVITLKFSNAEAFQAFVRKADATYDAKKFVYMMETSPFAMHVELAEEYDLTAFYAAFLTDFQYVKDYLALPELGTANVEHLSSITNNEAKEGYEYQGAYRLDRAYYLHVTSDQKATLVSLTAEYALDLGESGSRVVRAKFLKNGCDLTKKALEGAMQERGKTGSAADLGEEIVITFTEPIGEEQALSFHEFQNYNLKENAKEFTDTIRAAEFLPMVGDEVIASDKAEMSVSVKVDSDLHPYLVKLGETSYEDDALASDEGEAVTFSEAWDGEELTVTVRTSEKSYTFYTVLAVIAMVVIAVIFGIVIYYSRKQRREEEHEGAEEEESEVSD
ncbi:MAG: hypothetical protein IJ744_00645 [Lachnospiraceae bacterium]|nr:hypothetical protein [Lachnospiraceae bacterium]